MATDARYTYVRTDTPCPVCGAPMDDLYIEAFDADGRRTSITRVGSNCTECDCGWTDDAEIARIVSGAVCDER